MISTIISEITNRWQKKFWWAYLTLPHPEYNFKLVIILKIECAILYRYEWTQEYNTFFKFGSIQKTCLILKIVHFFGGEEINYEEVG